MLSPTMHKLLSAWYRHSRTKGKMFPNGWLFPGQNRINPLSTRQLNRAFHTGLEHAEIIKRLSLHSLRHAFATHLLERKIDIRVVQVLLGHTKITSTEIYSHVADSLLREVVSPLEYLDFKLEEQPD